MRLTAGNMRLTSGNDFYYSLRDMDSSDSFRADHLLLAGHDVFQKIDGDVVIWWQVYSDIGGEKVINLALAVVLGLKLLRRDLRRLILSWNSRTHLLIRTVHIDCYGI